MTAYNRAEVQQALAQWFGIKGSFPTDVDGTILPTMVVGDLTDSPYLRYSIPCHRSTNLAAVAAEFGYILARPGVNVALQVTQIIVQNKTAAGVDFVTRILTQGNVTTAGLAEAGKLLDMSGPEAGSLRPSSIWSGTHTALVGTGGQRFTVAADDTLIWTLPSPGIILYGNDPGGVPALAICSDAVNTAMDDVGFVCREWPLPG